jgi:hypothetical protein
MALQLGEIVASLGGELQGDAALRIEGLAPLESTRNTARSWMPRAPAA